MPDRSSSKQLELQSSSRMVTLILYPRQWTCELSAATTVDGGLLASGVERPERLERVALRAQATCDGTSTHQRVAVFRRWDLAAPYNVASNRLAQC